MENTYIKIEYKGKLTEDYEKRKVKKAKFVYKGKTTKKYDKNVCETIIKDAFKNKIPIKKQLNSYRIYNEKFLLKEKKKIDTLSRKIKRKKLIINLTAISMTLGLALYGFGNKKKEEAPTEPTTITASTPETNEEEEIKYFINHEGVNEEDKSAYKNIKDKYILPIAEYSYIYGLDTNLVLAVLTQENKNEEKNEGLTGGHGIGQIEGPVWNGKTVEAYNFVKNEYEVSDPIDVFRCDEDPDYCIKISCMILNNHYNIIHNNYSDKFTPDEEVQATLIAYNKGIGTVEDTIDESKNFEEFKKNIVLTPDGDNEYLHHVLSYMYNDEVITMKTDDNNEYTMQIINTANDAAKDSDEEKNYVEDNYIPSEGNSYIKRHHK